MRILVQPERFCPQRASQRCRKDNWPGPSSPAWKGRDRNGDRSRRRQVQESKAPIYSPPS